MAHGGSCVRDQDHNVVVILYVTNYHTILMCAYVVLAYMFLAIR